MIDTTFTGALAQIAIATKSDSNLTLARIEATLALLQRTAADHGISTKALLTSLTEKADFNAVVASFWKKAEESVQLAEDDKGSVPAPEIKERSVSKTPALDQCGTWDSASKCTQKPGNDDAPQRTPEKSATFDACGTWGEKCPPENQQKQAPILEH
jgi:hypothetical protein